MKNRKKIFTILIFSVCMLLLGVVIALVATHSNSDFEAETFSFEEYKGYVGGLYSFDKTWGKITGSEDAKAKAEKTWLEIYGEDVKQEKPYNVFFDEQAGVWFVTGTLPANMLGGVANILMEHDSGKVLAVWHTK